jgi:hypothetical protein
MRILEGAMAVQESLAGSKALPGSAALAFLKFDFVVSSLSEQRRGPPASSSTPSQKTGCILENDAWAALPPNAQMIAGMTRSTTMRFRMRPMVDSRLLHHIFFGARFGCRIAAMLRRAEEILCPEECR